MWDLHDSQMTNSVIIFGGIGFISADPPLILLLQFGQINFEEGFLN